MKYRSEVFDRKTLNRIFGRKGRQSDGECWKLHEFIVGTIIGSGYECKVWRDFCVFQQTFKAPAASRRGQQSLIAKLYDERTTRGTDCWPVFQVKDIKNEAGDIVTTSQEYGWFQNGMRVSDWIEY